MIIGNIFPVSVIGIKQITNSEKSNMKKKKKKKKKRIQISSSKCILSRITRNP